MADINKTIGEKIRFMRVLKKFSRERVARRIGVVQQTIEKYEKGTIPLTIDRLIQICEVLNIDASNLITICINEDKILMLKKHPNNLL